MSHSAKFQVSEGEISQAVAWRDQAAGAVEVSIFDLIDEPSRSVLDGLEVATVPAVDWATFLDGVDVRTVDLAGAPEFVRRIIGVAREYSLQACGGHMARGLFEQSDTPVHLRGSPVGLTAADRAEWVEHGYSGHCRVCVCGERGCSIGPMLELRFNNRKK